MNFNLKFFKYTCIYQKLGVFMEMKPVGFKGKIYSAEYKRDFETEYSVAKIKSEPNEPNKLRLTIDGLGDVSWFRQKQREFLQSIGIKVSQEIKQTKMKNSL